MRGRLPRHRPGGGAEKRASAHQPPHAAPPNFYRQVYHVIRQVPRGKVVTYGQVAAILGVPRAARAVGYALRALPRPLVARVPWQRVVNARGAISPGGGIYRPEVQRLLLRAEGIRFNREGCLDLRRHRWPGPRRERRGPARDPKPSA